jgi:flagella basal body P-ring formation protein FlgA
MSRRHIFRALFALVPACLLLSAANAAASGPAEDPAQVTAAIRQILAAQAPSDSTITLGPVQGARFMQACPVPLGVVISGVAPYEQAAVSCPEPAWTLYVTVTIAETQLVAVAARPIQAGQVIGPADLTIAREPVALYAGRQVFYNIADAAGGTALVSLPAGAILTAADMAAPVMVQAGQTVTVAVETGGLTVSLNAVADQTGRVGETILMTNPASGKHFQALVTRNGLVVQLQ